ncbi:MAG: cyclic nucleotide-binding/CBS domain-containing protein [Halomonadaceae bacterium]|nr:MAG: cyclic nucleotide-binding/CBS domain-containing protein [Halomonadaceae bacterium]
MNTQSLSPELSAIVDFIRQTLPFSALPDTELHDLVRSIEITYYRNGQVFDDRTREQGLRIVRSGAVELRGQDGDLLDRLGEGENFNLHGLIAADPGVRAILIEDSLLYFLPQAEYQELRKRHRDFDRFFNGQRSRRLFRATRSMVSNGTMTRPVRTLMTRDLVSIHSSATIRELAQLMSEQRVSSALVLEEERLLGIITDRDLRTRVLAAGLDGNAGVQEIMTPEPISLGESATLFDAMLLMTQHGLHHLPVVEGQQPVGILTTSDLIVARQDDPVYIVQRLSRATSAGEIHQMLEDVPRFLMHWSDDGVPADQVSHVLTAISDAVTRRLIVLAEDTLGPAPVPYCWVGFGSQARGEQLLNADQDNALIISDEATAQQLPWFEAMAKQVSDGLDLCGYVYCKGNIMATNPDLRRSVSEWQAAVDRWTTSFTPRHVMEVSIVFDIRAIHGDPQLATQVQQHMLRRVQASSIFQAALAGNVLGDTPPIGIFRRFVVEHNGQHKDTLNLKKRGLLPIVEMVRLHALAAGISSVNTLERLQELARSKRMTRYDSRNLADALRFLMQVRLQIQAAQIRESKPLSNHVNPRELPKLAREQLRDAFKIVDNAQRSVRLTYLQGMR